jgi:hypothetical protein
MNGRTQEYFDLIEDITINRKLYFAKLHLLKTLIEEGKKKEAKELIDEELIYE